MSETITEQITYKWLDGDDLDQLETVLESHGWTSLNKPTSRALGAFHHEELIGFMVLQMVPHTEPLYIKPQYRGQLIAECLAAQMSGFMESIHARSYMVMADTPEAVKLCEANGMRRVTAPVYMKVGE